MNKTIILYLIAAIVILTAFGVGLFYRPKSNHK